MKKNLLIFLLFCVVVAFGQSTPQPWGGKNSTIEVLGGLKIDSGLQIPVWDTTKKYTGKGVSSTYGVIVINSRDSNVCVLKNGHWVEVGAGSGGTVTSVSVENANGFMAFITNPTTAPDITIALNGSTGTGLLRAAFSPPFYSLAHATPGVDYQGVTPLVNLQSGVSYIFAITDCGQDIFQNNASPSTYTIPLNAITAFPIGTIINIYNIGAGKLTVAPDGGVTLNTAVSIAFSINQYGEATIKKTDTNTWLIYGTLVP